ncbi:hypothetical protein HCG51_31080 [Tolypothrix sp. PCC 7910]|uniref:hypothetical protein n=1 Tax=Tolypothrix sp. PCC 7910 TaxID=2099387 RepID=UPI00142781CD|nr:hypothetical protein [Tolypothrix sp. PCC 7910]QIR40700.1 hypothetical protein HCG51_31080 [Tolypothrix sp. PCC 7910]
MSARHKEVDSDAPKDTVGIIVIAIAESVTKEDNNFIEFAENLAYLLRKLFVARMLS